MDSGDTCSGGSYNSVCNVKSRSQNFAINIFFFAVLPNGSLESQ